MRLMFYNFLEILFRRVLKNNKARFDISPIQPGKSSLAAVCFFFLNPISHTHFPTNKQANTYFSFELLRVTWNNFTKTTLNQENRDTSWVNGNYFFYCCFYATNFMPMTCERLYFLRLQNHCRW